MFWARLVRQQPGKSMKVVFFKAEIEEETTAQYGGSLPDQSRVRGL